MTSAAIKAAAAKVMRQHLPVALLEMIEAGTWPGECLVVMGNPLVRPSAPEIAQNYCFLKPLVAISPTKVECGECWVF